MAFCFCNRPQFVFLRAQVTLSYCYVFFEALGIRQIRRPHLCLLGSVLRGSLQRVVRLYMAAQQANRACFVVCRDELWQIIVFLELFKVVMPRPTQVHWGHVVVLGGSASAGSTISGPVQDAKVEGSEAIAVAV